VDEINESLSYRAAMDELQQIVTRLRETENVDVDDLVKDVARAKQLIDFCGGKIKKADTAIKTIVGELQVADAQGQSNVSGTTPAEKQSRDSKKP
jgi:exodeoxyribonuclease VII small subunit